MERLEFTVEGSRGDEYRIAFEVDGETATAFCTCQAGSNGLACKHRIGLMDGDISDLLSGNPEGVKRLQTALQGTDLAATYNWVQQAEAAAATAKKELESAKRALSTVMRGQDVGAILATIPSGLPVPPSAFKMNDRVVVARDIQGTGIKAGAEGKVIYVQHGKRDIGRSTDLAGHAFQVRFKGGAEIWMTADEIVPA